MSSTDIATLQLRIQSMEAELASTRLDNLTSKAGKTNKATDGLTRVFKKLAAPILAVVSAVAALNKVISVTREFNKLNAQLVAATGSAEGAKVAYSALNDFMISTPFNIQNLTDAFVTLVNSGLNPSEKAMTAYGDWAAAMGRDISDLTNAVSSAVVGNTESLKSFGVQMSTNGDQIKATFRGVSTTIKNNSEEIEKYLIGIGENNFAGTMEARLGNLDDALATLQDQWDNLWLAISDTGLGDLITESVLAAGEAIEELTAMISSGELAAYAWAFAQDWVQVWDQVVRVVNYFIELWDDVPDDFKEGATDACNYIIDSFKILPTAIKGWIQRLGVEISFIVEYGEVYGGAFLDVMINYFKELVDKSTVYGKAAAAAMNPFADAFDLEGELANVTSQYSKANEDVWSIAQERLDNEHKARMNAIQDIQLERDIALDSFEKQIQKGKELRAVFDKEQSDQRTGDRLEQFAITPDKSNNVDQKALDGLIKSLMTEEEKIQESYLKRRQIILENTQAGSDAQLELLDKLNTQYREQVLGNEAVTYEEQLQKLQEYWDRRLEIVLNNTKLTEEERTKLESELTTKRNNQLTQLENKRYSTIFAATSQGFDGLADLAKTFAGEQSGIFKGLFAVSKGFAVATATMNMYTGISEAVKLGWPEMLPGIAAATTQGAAALSNIKSSNFSGAYDEGGIIPAGKFGIVGEYGPELINGPTNVTSRKSTEELLGNVSGDSGKVTVNVYNMSEGVNAEVQEHSDGQDKQIDVIITQVKNEIRDDFNSGGELSNTLENRFGLKRGNSR